MRSALLLGLALVAALASAGVAQADTITCGINGTGCFTKCLNHLQADLAAGQGTGCCFIVAYEPYCVETP
jgi:hypothetical protein